MTDIRIASGWRELRENEEFNWWAWKLFVSFTKRTGTVELAEPKSLTFAEALGGDYGIRGC